MRINTEKLDLEDFGTEIVFIEIKTGSYFTVKGLAIEAIRPLIKGCLRETFENWLPSQLTEVEELAAIRNIIQKFAERGFFLESAETAALGSINRSLGPTLFKEFNDVQDIIKLDPLHEVQHTGWPNSLNNN